MVDSASLARAGRALGTPCFVYDLDAVRARVGDVREAFRGRYGLSYAVKANPNPRILEAMRGLVDTLDISSGGELRLALRAGWPAELLSFTGPAKRSEELRAAVDAGVGEVVVESVEEARELGMLAREAGRAQGVLLRVAPGRLPRGFGVNMAGKPTQFGVDEEGLAEVGPTLRAIEGLDWAGVHIFSGTQCVDADAVVENYRIFAEVFRAAAQHLDISPRKLVFGSGMGVPYHAHQTPLDLTRAGAGAADVFDGLRGEPGFGKATALLETGRFLVAEAGVYLTRVLRVKASRGKTVVICDGGMNHHLGACGHLGSVIHRNYPIFLVEGDADGAPVKHELVGPLCTTIDTLGHGVELPALRPGDMVGVGCSGAYGATASPLNFISHPAVTEAVFDGDELHDVSWLEGSVR